MKGILLGLALLSATAAAGTARASPKPVPGPVAVMPFRNLNDGGELDWMKAGIAETMISDLKKSGRVRVVEREEVDRAMSEIALQETSGTEEATAAKVGKLVGAKTIVLGSFQKAGAKLRINARFVAVETGEILDTAKTTGPAADPFALQDRIVAQLLGVKPGAPALRHRKPATKKTVEAYRLYAMAITTASDAERVGYLKASLAIDPDFVYSLDDLEALKKRLGGYAQANAKALTADQSALLAKFRDAALPIPDRARAAGKLEDSLLNSRRFHTLVDVGGEVYAARLPKSDELPADPTQYAAYCRVIALHRLKRLDEALQFGEAYLKEFPGGFGYENIDRTVRAMIAEREKATAAKAGYELRLRAERARIAGDAPVPPAAKELEWEYAPCSAAQFTGYYAGEAEACGAFADKYAASTDAAAQRFVRNARFNAFTADGVVGRFDDARRYGDLLAGDPDYADTIQTIVGQTFPAD